MAKPLDSLPHEEHFQVYFTSAQHTMSFSMTLWHFGHLEDISLFPFQSKRQDAA